MSIKVLGGVPLSRPEWWRLWLIVRLQRREVRRRPSMLMTFERGPWAGEIPVSFEARQ